MTTFVELRPTRLVAGEIEWCKEAEACQFSVYVGEPGDFLWLADFSSYLDARNWAEEVQKRRNEELIDHIEREQHG